MHRVLKKDGRLMLIDGSRDTLLGKLIFGIVIKKLEENVCHVLRDELKGLFENVGFTPLERKPRG